MKEQKLRVFLDITFRPNEALEKKIKAMLKRPFRMDSTGQFLGATPQRDLTFLAEVASTKVPDLRRIAFVLRRLEGVSSVSFSLVERIALTKAPDLR